MWCQNYRNWQHRVVADPHWDRAKDIVWEKSNKRCQLCRKPYKFEFHHISYRRVCDPDEWKDVRLLCDTCHHSAGFFLWILKIPSKHLAVRYYQLKMIAVIKLSVVWAVRYLVLNYSTSLSSVQRRNVSRWGYFGIQESPRRQPKFPRLEIQPLQTYTLTSKPTY